MKRKGPATKNTPLISDILLLAKMPDAQGAGGATEFPVVFPAGPLGLDLKRARRDGTGARVAGCTAGRAARLSRFRRQHFSRMLGS